MEARTMHTGEEGDPCEAEARTQRLEQLLLVAAAAADPQEKKHEWPVVWIHGKGLSTMETNSVGV